jgi:methionyl-tRNA formyltransferase
MPLIGFFQKIEVITAGSALRLGNGNDMRVAFMGTPEFAVPTLNALVAAGHDVVAAYTQPPRPAGRGKKLMPSAVQLVAEDLGIQVRSPASLRKDEEQSAFAALGADCAVVAAYGLILPPAILDAPRLGCLNVHGSLLPRWRGAAPVQRAILAGDAETGVMVMQMDAGLDTGAVRASAATTIGAKTAGELTAELAAMGAALMTRVLADIRSYPAIAQKDDIVTYAAKIGKAETRLDFTQSAEAVERQIRAFNPAAWFEFEGERYRVLAANIAPLPVGAGANGGGAEAEGLSAAGTVLDSNLTIACAAGAIRPATIQRAGKPAMALNDFLRGNTIPAGTQL